MIIGVPITMSSEDLQAAKDAAVAQYAATHPGVLPFFYVQSFVPGFQLFFQDVNGVNVAPVQAGTRYYDTDWPFGATQVQLVNMPDGYVLDCCFNAVNNPICFIFPAYYTSVGPSNLGTPNVIVKAASFIQILSPRQIS